MLTADDLGAFGNLAQAIGLTTDTGANSAWFGAPVGGDANPHGLKDVLTDPGQRNALLTFVDDVLGPPAAHTEGTQKWVPLFQNVSPTITVYAVVEVVGGAVRLGVAIEHSTGSTAPFVTTRVHVPLIHLPDGATDGRADNGIDPKWLLIGHAGGRIGIEIEATFTDAPPIPREAYLRGATVGIAIPTSSDDNLEFDLELIDLQVPGAATPSTQRLAIDSLNEIGTDVLEFVVGLVRAQAASLDLNDEAFRHIAGLLGVLGLRDVDGLPPFPLADIATQGADALVHWAEHVLQDNDARDAWIGELARLVGGQPEADRDAVSFDVGDVAIVLGLRVDTGAGGHPVLVPWAEVSYGTRVGVSVGGGLDLFRLDTGTGTINAIPQIRAEAVFGADTATGAARLLPTGPVQIGSVHVGVHLDTGGREGPRPSFALTLHDVDISAGGSPRHHDLLDLSSPDAALDALDSAIDDALSSALDGLGAAGGLAKQLL